MRFTIHLAIVIVIVIVQSANENGNQNEWTIACPCGLVSMWYGSNDFPAGYQLCDGTNGTPDLKGKFIIGSTGIGSGDFPAEDEGGSNEITIGVNNLPKHDHDVGTIATSEDVLEGSHTHSISGEAKNVEETLHSHDLTSKNAPISKEAAHTHDIPPLKTTEDAGHNHEVQGTTTADCDASHTHSMDFYSQGEKTPHTHTIPAHDTNGGVDDGDHDHFIYAYEDAASGGAIPGVTYETIGNNGASGRHAIDTEGEDEDGLHGHDIDEQTTNTNSGHVHQIDGSTDKDGDHSHDIEGDTTGDNDGVHYHTTDEDETDAGSEHTHKISGNTEIDGSHTHDVEGETEEDGGVHSHTLVGKTAMTGSGEAIVYYPPYVALQYICCTRASPN
eukprot:866101_1